MTRVLYKVVLLASVYFLTRGGSSAFASTNAPASRFHPELADMVHVIEEPVVLTNSPLLGMSSLQVSNHFAKAGFHWRTNDVAVVNTGYARFPHSPGYHPIFTRMFALTFVKDKVIRVEVFDRPGGCVIIEQRK